MGTPPVSYRSVSSRCPTNIQGSRCEFVQEATDFVIQTVGRCDTSVSAHMHKPDKVNGCESNALVNLVLA